MVGNGPRNDVDGEGHGCRGAAKVGRSVEEYCSDVVGEDVRHAGGARGRKYHGWES